MAVAEDLGWLRREPLRRINRFWNHFDRPPNVQFVAATLDAIRLKRQQKGTFLSELELLYLQADGHCAYCRYLTWLAMPPHCDLIPGRAVSTIDHMVPQSRGGANGLENLALACRQCNEEKDSMTAPEYAAWKADMDDRRNWPWW